MCSDVLSGRAEHFPRTLGKLCTLLEGEVRGGWGALGALGSSSHRGHWRVLGRQKKNMGVLREISETCGMGGMLVFELSEGNFEAWDLTPQCQGTLGSWRSSALPMQPEICSAALGWVPGLALRPLPCCYLGVPRYYSWL